MNEEEKILTQIDELLEKKYLPNKYYNAIVFFKDYYFKLKDELVNEKIKNVKLSYFLRLISPKDNKKVKKE